MNEALEVVWELSPLGLCVMSAVRDSQATIFDFDMLFLNRNAAKALGRTVEQVVGHRYRKVFTEPVYVQALGRMTHAVENAECYSHTSNYDGIYDGDEFDTFVWPTGDLLACLFTPAKYGAMSEELRMARSVIERQRGALNAARNVEATRTFLDSIQ